MGEKGRRSDYFSQIKNKRKVGIFIFILTGYKNNNNKDNF